MKQFLISILSIIVVLVGLASVVMVPVGIIATLILAFTFGGVASTEDAVSRNYVLHAAGRETSVDPIVFWMIYGCEMSVIASLLFIGFVLLVAAVQDWVDRRRLS